MATSHLWFDLAAYLAAAALTLLTASQQTSPVPAHLRTSYLLVMTQGVIFGSLLLGTMNLHLLGVTNSLGKSILGAICGGIVAVEVFKSYHAIRGSTGARLVPGLALGIVIGRLGCFFSGLQDYTFGTPTSAPWAVDLGDGIARHPVQLYESGAMVVPLLVCAAVGLARDSDLACWIRARGFYLFAFYYAVQRFGWEFLKPYANVIGPLNLFHLACIALAGYALFMLRQPCLQPALSARSTS